MVGATVFVLVNISHPFVLLVVDTKSLQNMNDINHPKMLLLQRCTLQPTSGKTAVSSWFFRVDGLFKLLKLVQPRNIQV